MSVEAEKPKKIGQLNEMVWSNPSICREILLYLPTKDVTRKHIYWKAVNTITLDKNVKVRRPAKWFRFFGPFPNATRILYIDDINEARIQQIGSRIQRSFVAGKAQYTFIDGNTRKCKLYFKNQSVEENNGVAVTMSPSLSKCIDLPSTWIHQEALYGEPFPFATFLDDNSSSDDDSSFGKSTLSTTQIITEQSNYVLLSFQSGYCRFSTSIDLLKMCHQLLKHERLAIENLELNELNESAIKSIYLNAHSLKRLTIRVLDNDPRHHWEDDNGEDYLPDYHLGEVIQK
ncbi:uncharacterized protein L201_006110 [Kwoniella dendrophila CBS 6074]|uniref:F-box domain-containing protein n=1 Tax=Kwoniella dendrophila CBS 6074 TaxID=1295534 RepID=A0AAX4K1B4_9TREE